MIVDQAGIQLEEKLHPIEVIVVSGHVSRGVHVLGSNTWVSAMLDEHVQRAGFGRPSRPEKGSPAALAAGIYIRSRVLSVLQDALE